MYATFDRFEIEMTRAQAESASHPGPCDSDVEWLLTIPKIKRSLAKINPDDIRAELREYGAWDDSELMDDAANLARIVWIAAGHISDEMYAS
jgi:hypothetical protein